MMNSLRKLPGFVAVLAAAGLFLTACPKANGYTIAPAFPQLRFSNMIGLQAVPGDAEYALLLTQDGVIRRANLADKAVAPTVFLDIRDRMIPNPGPEQGLLGLAYSPDYATSGRFYIYYTVGGPMRNRISRFVAHGDTADLASEQVLLEINQPFQNHDGGRWRSGRTACCTPGSAMADRQATRQGTPSDSTRCTGRSSGSMSRAWATRYRPTIRL